MEATLRLNLEMMPPAVPLRVDEFRSICAWDFNEILFRNSKNAAAVFDTILAKVQEPAPRAVEPFGRG